MAVILITVAFIAGGLSVFISMILLQHISKRRSNEPPSSEELLQTQRLRKSKELNLFSNDNDFIVSRFIESSNQVTTLESRNENHQGTITLVGAGPGSVDLLTVAAVNAIKTADVIVADRLVSENVLRLANGEVIISRKTYGNAEGGQEDIYQSCLKALSRGLHVVRLKGGDPFVFGRGGEEVLWFRHHGFEAKIIPGISSCIAAPVLSRIPLTTRGVADRFLVCTAYGKQDTEPQHPKFDSSCTFVFLMGARCIEKLVKKLTSECNFPNSVSACIIQQASLPAQREFFSSLIDLPQIARVHAIQPPATIIIGHVINCLVQR